MNKQAKIKILGISAFYHDSAAVVIEDGKIIAAAQEERFSRKKNDLNFPSEAIKFCVKQNAGALDDLKRKRGRKGDGCTSSVIR